MVSVIIPAWNEERTVARVIAVALGTPSVREVIVVNDGSTDNTARVARNAGVVVLDLPQNLGKAQAMEAGVRASRGNILLFLDADVEGLTPEILEALILPVVSGKHVMCVGLRGRRLYVLNKLLHYVPLIGGERALTRQLWDSVPTTYKRRFEIEIALNYFAKRTTGTMKLVLMSDVRQIIKEKKYGAWRGFVRRIGMVYDVVAISVRLYIIRTLVVSLRNLYRVLTQE